MKTLLWIVVPVLLSSASFAFSDVDSLVSWEGEVAGEQYGISVAIGFDLNGDGRADLAVGSSASDEAGTNAGKVSIYLGRPNPTGQPDLELYGPPGSFFGAAIACAGDVNNDGFDDLLVGAFRDSSAGASAGKAFLYLGSDPIDGTPDLVLSSPGAGAYFGRAVCAAGDVNGDGYADFAVGAPRTTCGSVHLYLGGSPTDTVAALVLNGLVAGDRFGSSIAGCGNADGLPGDDLLVGAPRASVGATWEGAAYLFSGGAALDTIPDWVVRGAAAGDQSGSAVAGAGDVNGDGAPDLLVGAPYWNNGPTVDAGAAVLYFGGAALDTLPDFTVVGSATEENLGWSLAGCGDVTGSGFGHFLVGAPGAGEGTAILSPGGDPPVGSENIVLRGETSGDDFGYSVAGGTTLSFTGSADPDLAIGAWSFGEAGKCYVYGRAAVSAVEAAEGRGLVAVSVWPNPGRSFRFSFPSGTFSKTAPGGSCACRASIYDVAGRVVRTLAPCSPSPDDGAQWDGTDSSGRAVPSGVYGYVIDVDGARIASGRIVLVR
jgi:hypothetical protein